MDEVGPDSEREESWTLALYTSLLVGPMLVVAKIRCSE